MPKYQLSQLAQVLGVASAVTKDRDVAHLLTDSRSLAFPGETLFFALVTQKGNGHRYVQELYERGVRAFVVSEEVEGDFSDACFLKVADTLKALQSVAAWHRLRLSMPVVGITGSNGKTTLKELLYQLLGRQLRVGRSPKSYNSAIGVPLSLWNIEDSDDLAIIEAGISQPGEMAVLEQMIQPQVGVITNVGEAHQENFATLAEKATEKAQLFARSEVVIYGEDQSLVSDALARLDAGVERLTWSRARRDATLFVAEVAPGREKGVTRLKLLLEGQVLEYEVPFLDNGTLEDLFLAILLVNRVAPEILTDQHLFRELEPISMRLEVLEGDNDTLLINDTYSSDFDSLKIALDFMVRRNFDHRPMALVLSLMRGSSSEPENLYGRVGELLREYDLEKLYLIGGEVAPFLSFFPENAVHFATVEDFLSESRDEISGHLVLLKGAREVRMERVVQRLQRQTHQTILDVNLSNIVHNLQQHRALLPARTKVICMIKADGYGVGSYEMARTLESQGVDYLAVALLDEGKELREKGIRTPIIVMNPQESTLAQLLEYHLQPEIYSLDLLRRFISVVEESPYDYFPIHLKWETGMNRLGLEEVEIERCVALLRSTTSVRVDSIFTHLAAADEPEEDEFTLGQLSKFARIHKRLTELLGYRPLLHALNTAGTLRFPEMAGDMVRLGIGLYGYAPVERAEEYGLKPVAELRTYLLQVREVPSGTTIGYGRRGKVDRPSRIGVIPIGYADGISRQLGNGRISFQTADGTLVPTIGNICMDTLMLDLTGASKALQAGDPITIFGKDISITRLAEACGTIPYEILARLSPRITRRYFSE